MADSIGTNLTLENSDTRGECSRVDERRRRSAAEREHSSTVNMEEMVNRDYCGRNGITIQEQQTLPLDDERKL